MNHKPSGIAPVAAPKPMKIGNAPNDGTKHGVEIPLFEIVGKRTKPNSETIRK
ncbi:MAG: hypothetical protein ACP5N9_05430 [Candidatus Bilamarchaeum sp.]|jgi:hypothetical protein